jgi:hypothetical protein
VTYRFEEQQPLVVRLYDIDSTMHRQSDTVSLDRQDFIGEIECQLAQIMGSRGCCYRANVANKSHTDRARGWITVRGEEIKNANAKFIFQLAAEKLDNKVSRVVGVVVVAVRLEVLCVGIRTHSASQIRSCVCPA